MLPGIAGILRAPPSVLTEGLASESNPPKLPTVPTTHIFSFHLSKILLFVKNKNKTRSFFFKVNFSRALRGLHQRFRVHFCCAIYSFFHQMQEKTEAVEKKLYKPSG